MKDDHNLLLVPLQPSDQEYKDVVKEFTSTLGRKPNIIKVIACSCPEKVVCQTIFTYKVVLLGWLYIVSMMNVG